MISIERTKELLADATISDQEAEKIRDSFRDLAEIIFNKWKDEYDYKNRQRRSA
jgi:hypothetical protein